LHPQVKNVSGACIHSTVPYIRTEVPVVVLFRALGFVSDRDILEHIVYDFADPQLMELVRPSLEEVRAAGVPCRHTAPRAPPAAMRTISLLRTNARVSESLSAGPEQPAGFIKSAVVAP
jgi:DNA-directed RNA polymerase beta subunit